MRPLLLLATATIFAACGATNVNQENYTKIKEAYEAEHGDSHGDAHGEDDKHEGEKKKSDDHGEKH